MRYNPGIFAFSFVIVACMIASCRKQRTENTAPLYTPAGTNITKELGNLGLAETQQVLEGKWYLLGSGGGIAGEYHASPMGIYHVFGKNLFTINNNGDVKEYPCTWQKLRSIYSADSLYQLTPDGGVAVVFLRIINDTLHTGDNAYDGFGRTYVKIK
jgi:hypothetical protein